MQLDPSITGAIGLPGAVFSIAGTFYFALMMWQKLMPHKSSANGNGNGSVSYKEATGMMQVGVTRVDLAERTIVADVGKTRHDIKNGLEIAIGRIESALDLQTDRLIATLKEGKND